MGVFLIRNVVSERVFLGVGQDLRGVMNRHKFELSMGSHPNKQLQADWNEFGRDSFAFEIVDQLDAPDDPGFDRVKELAFMEQLWLEKLKPFGSRGYNERKLSKEEMLRRIARQ
jgi:hypothetical protein